MYDYFKEQFLQKKEEFGREKLIYEKEELNNVTKTIIEGKCKNKENVDNVCKYLNKPELDFIDEIRKTQSKKSFQKIFDKIQNVHNKIKYIQETRKNKDALRSITKMQETINNLQFQLKQYFENEKDEIWFLERNETEKKQFFPDSSL